MAIGWNSVSIIAGVILSVNVFNVAFSQETDSVAVNTPDYFFKGMLSEATEEVVRRDAKFMLFVYGSIDSLTSYYLDTLFVDRDIANKLENNFVCIAADTASDKGSTIVKQFRIKEFPSILFVDKRGQEYYSKSGRLELDQMFDTCERAMFSVD